MMKELSFNKMGNLEGGAVHPGCFFAIPFMLVSSNNLFSLGRATGFGIYCAVS
jgi:hypothetical protein